MNPKLLLTVSALFLLNACASSLHRGIIAMRIDEKTAHVGLNADEVKVGDHVQLYGNKCTAIPKSSSANCVKVSKGHGVITEIIGNDYSAVQFDDGVKFQEGDFIEKLSH